MAVAIEAICFPSRNPRPHIRRCVAVAVAGSRSIESSVHDVVVVGGGIIGLAIARHILLHTTLSVAIADAAVPCSGATGAGQGYIWMGHRTPGTATWELAVRSKQMWDELAASIEKSGGDPRQELGWIRTGSVLIGRTPEELVNLQERDRILSLAGIRTEYLSASALGSLEPELCIGKNGEAVFVPEDSQLDAFKAVSFIERVNDSFIVQGRYAKFYHDPAISLLRSERSGNIEGVQTSHNILYGRKAIVIAAGAWTGLLLKNLLEDHMLIHLPMLPRKGHLLVLENVHGIKLNHALMELGYVDHQGFAVDASKEVEDKHKQASISMTATLDMEGNLVLGSSRQFDGFSTEINYPIVRCILERAGDFFPKLKILFEDEHIKQIRVGHRPYLPDGKPVIGFIPGMQNILLATGHEGSGLCLALGTAEMVTDLILGNHGKVDCTPFTLGCRFSG